MKISIGDFENHTKEMFDQFLRGDQLSQDRNDVRLCTTILNTVDLVDKRGYKEVVDRVKKIMSMIKRSAYKDIFMIEISTELTPKEKAVAIRLINLAHKEKKPFIIINDELVYVPDSYSKYNSNEVYDYVNSLLKTRECEKTLSDLKSKIKDFFHPFRKKKVIDTPEQYYWMNKKNKEESVINFNILSSYIK